MDFFASISSVELGQLFEFNNDIILIITGSVLLCFATTGSFVNGINLINYFTHKKLQTVTNRLIISMSFTDFLMSTFVTTSCGLFCLFPRLGPWLDKASPHGVEVLGFLFYVVAWIGFYIIPLVGLNRLLYVCYNKVLFICILIFLSSSFHQVIKFSKLEIYVTNKKLQQTLN